MSNPPRHDEFTFEHHDITPAIDPTKVKLAKPFVICIIGASSGIGEHISYAYARAGATGIILSSRNTTELARVASRVREIDETIQVEIVACDISSSASVKALSEKVTSCFGRLDILVPNSGYAGPVTLKVTEGDPAWFQHNFDINTVGTYHAAHYFIPLLLASENGAKGFLCIGSQASGILNGPIANTGYCLSKFAQSRLLEYLGQQFGGEGLFAVNIHPGAVMTPMAAGNTPEEFLPCEFLSVCRRTPSAQFLVPKLWIRRRRISAQKSPIFADQPATDLVDSIDLCGAFCVWLSKQTQELQWLTGRFISANWDVDELLAKKALIIEKDLLKWRIALT